MGIGNPVLTLDARVLFVRRAKLALRSAPLVRRHLADMDIEAPGWEAQTGIVDAYLPDWQTGALRLYLGTTAPERGSNFILPHWDALFARSIILAMGFFIRVPVSRLRSSAAPRP